MLREDLIEWLAKYDALESKPMVSDTINSLIGIFKQNNYVEVRKGDIYWTRESLSAPDWAAKYYKE